MSKNSELIFKGQQHKLSAPFHEVRSGGRLHEGADYGTYQKAAVQYCPLDGGVVYKVVTTETNGNARGLYADIRWKEHDIGIIFQHASKVAVRLNQAVMAGDQIVLTGMTGKDKSGKRVSTGIHAHIELYKISTGARMDFEKFDFEELMEVVKNIKILLDGKEKTVESINKGGYNFIKLRDLEPAVSVDYDAKKNLPIVNSRK